MIRTIENEYFDWVCNLVCGGDRFRLRNYRSLLRALHNKEFVWYISNDENRAEEGVTLRYRFACDIGYDPNEIYIQISYPCSVLEMMAALAIRCEESIMADPQIGDRTSQWFWGMIRSLGLNGMRESYFYRDEVDNILNKFIERQYDSNGRGGLFTINNCNSDLRDVEIWHQLCWYLDNLEGY